MSVRGRILLLITLLDSFITGIGVHTERMVEFNPAMSWLINNGGVFLFIMFRAMFVMFLVARFDRMSASSESGKHKAVYLYNIAIFFYVTALIFWTATAQYIWTVVLRS